MNYLTLIGGPYAKPRTSNAPPFTTPVLNLGGEVYVRDEKSLPGDAVYVHAGYCEHEWSDWIMMRTLVGSYFTRLCVKCPESESQGCEDFKLTGDERVCDDTLPETKLYPEGLDWFRA